MSDIPSRDATGRKKPTAATSRRAVRPQLRVAPEDRTREPVPLLKRIKDDARAGVRGLLVSLGFHLLILLVMALIVVTHGRFTEGDALDGAWLVPRAETAGRVPAAPIQLDAFRPNPAATKKVEEAKPPSETAGPPSPQNVPVKPPDVKRLLDARNPRRRSQMLARHGGTDQTERAITAGLAWVVRQQQSAGNWRLHEGYPDAALRTLRTDTGATALALLALLGAGETHIQGQHQTVVRKGLEWLKAVQQPDGNFHDNEGEIGRQSAFYAHSQATIALCEAYAMTGDPSFREPAERGIEYLLEVQRQSTGGGWKYSPVHDKGDLSVTGWALMALHTARVAGIDVPEDAFMEASIFLDSVQEQDGARYKYEPTDPRNRVTPAMTAEGLLCRQFLGWPRDYPPLLDGIAWLTEAERRPEWSGGRRNVYAWYYTGQVLHNVGGETFNEWYADVQQAIVPHQARTGNVRAGQDIRGSWHPTTPPGDHFEYADKAGRLYLTTLCLLVLETPYRHLSIYGDETDDESAEGN